MKAERLIIFTRFPEPGQTKTRLIPVLGAEGAADLHRAMTEHTVGVAREWQRGSGGDIEVAFDGAEVSRVQAWLGKGLLYAPQSGQDLGTRMLHALERAFREGAKRAVLVGTDCPGRTASMLNSAFASLGKHEVVLGSTSGGGYQLIGLRKPLPALFSGVAWGTDTVFEETLALATRLGVTVARLPILQDVDRPEDLPAWEETAR